MEGEQAQAVTWNAAGPTAHHACPSHSALGLDHFAAAKLATSGLLSGMLESNCIYADRDKQRLWRFIDARAISCSMPEINQWRRRNSL